MPSFFRTVPCGFSEKLPFSSTEPISMPNSLRFSIVSLGREPWRRVSMKTHSLSIVLLAHWTSVASVKAEPIMSGM